FRNATMTTRPNLLADAIVQQHASARALPVAAIGGSDSHTLRGVGTTYTETAGAGRSDFLRNLRAGRCRPGGRHGGMFREAQEIYGVVFRYWASLLGIGRQNLSWHRRMIGLGFSAISMPFE